MDRYNDTVVEPEFLNFTVVQPGGHAPLRPSDLRAKRGWSSFSLAQCRDINEIPKRVGRARERVAGQCEGARGWDRRGGGGGGWRVRTEQHEDGGHPTILAHNPFVSRPPSVRSRAQYSPAPRRLVRLHPDERTQRLQSILGGDRDMVQFFVQKQKNVSMDNKTRLFENPYLSMEWAKITPTSNAACLICYVIIQIYILYILIIILSCL